MDKMIQRLKGGLVVSSQAPDKSPLCKPDVLAAMALAGAEAGAAGLRLNGADVISRVRKHTKLPIIGIFKDYGYEVYITPTFRHARAVARAGADIINIDATMRRKDLVGIIAEIHAELGVLVGADVSTYEEGLRAAECGADLLASTLSGYVGKGPVPALPDFKLVSRLAKIGLPVMAEGRYATPEHVRRAIKLGAHCVCVGTAITRPDVITKEFLP